jgi:hypothetical protein
MDLYVMKTDSAGSLQWSKTYGGTGVEAWEMNAQQTRDGGFIIVSGTSSFGAGSFDCYLIKTDSLGNSGCNETNPNTLVGSGGLQGTGGTQGTIGTSTTPVTDTGSGGVENILCLTAGIKENNFRDNSLNFSPNPFTSQTALHTVDYLNNATLIVDNCFGQAVSQIKNITGQTIIFNRDNLPSGLYFIRLIQDSKVVVAHKLFITD